MLEVFLAILVGILFGALMMLIVDGFTMSQRVKSANKERNQAHQDLQKTQADLHKTNKKLTTTQAEVKSLAQDLLDKKNELNEKAAVIGQNEQQLDAANAQIDLLNDNLNRVNQSLDELRRENQTLAAQLNTAQKDNDTLRENLTRTDDQLQKVRAEKDEVCQQMRVNEIETRHLQENLTQTRTLADRASVLITEKEGLANELRHSEQQAAQLRAQVNSVVRQLTETQTLRRTAVEAEEKLKTAESNIQRLHAKLKILQAQMAYTGKSELQIIKGIGPVYAQKLNEHGIYTLRELARTEPETVREYIGLKRWQGAEPEEWVEEARVLAVHFGEG